MSKGKQSPFEPAWDITEDQQEELYLRMMKELSVVEAFWAECEYGDGNIDITQLDREWIEDWNTWGCL